MGVVEIVWVHRQAYLDGLSVTLRLCAIAWGVGLLGGALLALLADVVGGPVSVACDATTRIVEAIPILVLLFWAHYPLQMALGVVIPPFVTMATLLAFLNTLAVQGILFRAIQRVPPEHIEAARVCGIPSLQTYWSIKLPLALRSCLGQLTSSQVAVLQLSIFGSLISVDEIFRVAQRINAITYRPVEVYTGIAIFFLAVCLPLNLLARRLDRAYAE